MPKTLREVLNELSSLRRYSITLSDSWETLGREIARHVFRNDTARGDTVKVLDHGHVMLVDWMGDDDAPLESARMSTGNPTGVDLGKDDRLRTRLWNDVHTSPFEMGEVVFELQVPIFVLRQMDRHRTLDMDTGDYTESLDENFRKFTSRNEFSGRYAVLPDLFYVPTAQRIQGKGKLNKQGSEGELPLGVQERVVELISEHNAGSRALYNELNSLGVSNELARLVLPPTQYTRIRLKGNLLNWLKFLKLRTADDVQWETRQFAIEMARLTAKLFPKHAAFFEKHLQDKLQVTT